jgi:pimeloyl-ACP methyl ester carboxylesterase
MAASCRLTPLQVGNSDTPWGLYSTSEMAKDLIDLLAVVGWKEDKSLNVVGVSMGGYVVYIPKLLRLSG